jgi:hypothetical protein
LPPDELKLPLIWQVNPSAVRADNETHFALPAPSPANAKGRPANWDKVVGQLDETQVMLIDVSEALMGLLLF